MGCKKDWTRAHALVDELETLDGMAVHAYLHRKGGQASNADYWYERAGANLIVPHLMKNGRRWLSVCFPALTKYKYPSRRDSQLPTAPFALESFVGFNLSCCASAMWTLHRANLSHNVNFSRLLTSFQD